MIGVNHAMSGVGMSVALTPILVVSVFDGNLTIPQVVSAGIVAAAFSVLPDLDHPGAKVTKSLGALSGVAAMVVRFGAGGHRQRTHSLPAWVLVSVGVWLLSLSWQNQSEEISQDIASVFSGEGDFSQRLEAAKEALQSPSFTSPTFWILWLTLLMTSGIAYVLVYGRFAKVNSLTAFIVGLSVATIILMFVEPGNWFWISASIGYITHLIGDGMTKSGVPLLLPFSKKRFKTPITFRTGTKVEEVVFVIWMSLLALVGYALWPL